MRDGHKTQSGPDRESGTADFDSSCNLELVKKTFSHFGKVSRDQGGLGDYLRDWIPS